MTDAIYARAAYAQSMEAIVTGVEAGPERPAVALDQTVFYPGGGGQPPDQGSISAPDGRHWTVSSARREGEVVLHELAAGEPPGVGVRVAGEIDWERRYLLMRTHTALHALSGVVWRDYGAQVTGGHMEPGTGRMDFEFEHLSADLVTEIETRVNVWPRTGTCG
jgi:misacylated tRNA(Ala) deacylase